MKRFNVGLWVTLIANLLVIILWIPFLTVPTGADIRPMGRVAQIGLVALVALAFGLPASLYDPNRSRRRIINIGLSLSPFPLFKVLLAIAMHIQGFTLAD